MNCGAVNARVADIDADTCALMQRKGPKSNLRRCLLTCTALVAVCTLAPLNAAFAQVNVVADGVGTIVDLSSFTFPPPINSVRAINGGVVINSGLFSPITITGTQYGVLAGGPGVPSTAGTITLNGVNVTASDAQGYTGGGVANGPRGLAAEGPGAVVDATNVNITLSHTGSTSSSNGTGLRAFSLGRLTANEGTNTVTMAGSWNHGIVASGGIVDTNATVVVHGDAAAGGNAFGAFAIGEPVSTFGPSTIILREGSSITNDAPTQGIGLYSLHSPQGVSIIDSSATVSTQGALRGYGALSQGNLALINLRGGSITTTGERSHGLFTFNSGRISADAAFGGVRTSGLTAHGALAQSGVMGLDGTTIETTGAGSHGIFAQQSGGLGGRVLPTLLSTDPAVAPGDVTVIFNGNVTASGESSHGIFANALTAGNAYVETSSAVSGGWGSGAGVLFDGLTGFARINAGSTVGALSDLAIRGITTGGGGTIQVENAGTVTGFVRFGGGVNSFRNDGTFNLRNFAKTTTGGGRDTLGVATADLGAGLSNSFTNNGTLALPAVTGATTLDSAGQYLPLGNPNNAMALNGPLQGHLIGVQTFTNTGTIDLQSNPVAGDVLAITGLRQAGVPGGPGTFVSNGGTLKLDTVLNEGGAASHSDVLVVDGTSVGAGGATRMEIRKAGGTGALTVDNGILVVQVLDPSRSAAGAFTLVGTRIREGAFDYRLFQGGPIANNSSDWFLRSTFFVPLVPIGPSTPVNPSVPIDPPPEVLPPGVFPIIGPELATYGVVQPIARQLGMTTLGTLHERVGDTSLNAIAGAPCVANGGTPDGIWRKAPVKAPTDCLYAGWGPSAWGRVIGQKIDNRYRAFADPRASGQLLGFQSGIDLWRGEWLPGHRDAAGIYVGYANANVDVSGRVTNEAATNYVLRRTGGLNLDAWSGAAYWTHYGPGGWYLDAVAQATRYEGAASTQFARLGTTGFGFLSSLETGYPIHLPMFGPGFVLEPQAQVVWQRVSFDDANDSLGDVALGTTSGASGRIGLRGKWTIVSDSGQVWQPYVRANLWRDWGARVTAIYSGADLVPLLEQANRLQLGGGVSVRMNPNVMLYANADYQLSVVDTDGGRRDGMRGAAGVRFMW